MRKNRSGLKKALRRGKKEGWTPRVKSRITRHLKKVAPRAKSWPNPPKNWPSGKWIKAEAVRVRKVAGQVIMDVKKAI